jgi:hypothetical protein
LVVYISGRGPGLLETEDSGIRAADRTEL